MLETMDDPGSAWGVGTLAASSAVFMRAVLGVRSGAKMASWTAVLAAAGAGLTAGALLLQRDAGLASWLIAPPVGAALGVANVRAIFAPGRR